MMFKRLLAAALAAAVLGASPVQALEVGLPVDAAITANARMLTNPPLPMVYYKKGTYKLNFAPYVFRGYIDGDSDANTHDHADVQGGGGAISYSWAFKDRWGMYVYGMGSKLGASNITASATNGQPTSTVFGNTHASFVAVSVGLVHQFFGENFDGFALPVFAGPMLAKVHQDPTHVMATTKNGATVQKDDYYVDVDNVQPGFMIGTQSAFNVGKNFQLNPFAMLAFMSKSADPNITNVKFQQSQAPPMATVQNGFGGFGLNLIYKPWNVSVNLTAPFITKAFKIDGAHGFQGNLFSLSWGFGNYVK